MPELEKSNEMSAWPRVILAFALVFAIYQASVGIQTKFAPESPLGPALMLVDLVVAGLMGWWLGRRGFAAFGLEPFRGWLLLLAAGLLLAILGKLAALGLANQFAGSSVEFAPALSLGFVAMALLTTFVPSIAEDIIVRGFLLRTVPVSLGGTAFVLASALLYTLNHVWRFDWGITEQLRLFCMGLAYGAAAWRWRSLWGAVALHWGWNLANALADGLFSVEAGSEVHDRLVTAGIHLVMLAIVLTLPSRKDRKSAT